MANGKWNHMMDQVHIGYTTWAQPDRNIMPAVKRIDPASLAGGAEMGVAIEGSTAWWPKESSEAVLPEFDPYNRQSYSIEIFNRGRSPFRYSIHTDKPWIRITPDKTGMIDIEKRFQVSVDWANMPDQTPLIERVPITITGPNDRRVIVTAVVRNPQFSAAEGFMETNGYISIEAGHYSRAVEAYPISWLQIPGLGRTSSAMTPLPVTASAQLPGGTTPSLEYRVVLLDTGEVNVRAYLSPTLNFHNTRGLRYAISFDDERPHIVNMHENDTIPDWRYPQWWNRAVSDNIIIKTSTHSIRTPGEHLLKFWMVDPGVVVQKLVVETGGVRTSYLGPPESVRIWSRQSKETKK